MRQSTKQTISEALRSLLEEQTIEQITVKKIVESCGINRQTFYYHFYDIYNLIEWTLADGIDRYLRQNPFPEGDWKEHVRHIYRFLFKNRKMILHAYDQNNRKIYERFIMKMVRPIISEKVEECSEAGRVTEEKKEFVVKIYCWLCTSLFFEWLEEGMPDEAGAALEDYFTVVEGSMSATLTKFINKK